jgi:hypothetical protein
MDLPHLSKGKRGFSTKFDLVKIIKTIIKRLKTDCQWREISIKDYFGEEKKVGKMCTIFLINGSKTAFLEIFGFIFMNRNKKLLDMSCVQLDGSQTRCRMGGESTGCQSRKSAKTSNMIFIKTN